MPQLRTRLLVMAATLVSGILAGGIIDRVIVGGPAWHELGAEAWVEYSRRADLWTGLVAYPVEGIGATLLIVAAALSNYFDRSARREVALASTVRSRFPLPDCCSRPRRHQSC